MANEKRLIDADTALQRLQNALDDCHEFKHSFAYRAVELVAEFLQEIPAVDAVEVVRCKDCKYWEYGKDYEPYCNHWGNSMADTVEDDFCSYGERRTDETD